MSDKEPGFYYPPEDDVGNSYQPPADGTSSGEMGQVSGENLGETTTVIEPSKAEKKADAKGRLGNTALQAGLPGALLIIATWWASLKRWDLDPGAGTDMPANVAGAWVVVLTLAVAYTMNRKNLNAKDNDPV